MRDRNPIYLEKAVESLAGAQSEYSNERYQNCANRSYYACFQAAVHALLEAGLMPPTTSETWSHKTLHSLFANQLIRQRKLYPSELRSILQRTYELRQAADYSDDLISEGQARRALQRARGFVESIHEREGGGS